MTNKRVCKECGWHGMAGDVLTAPNPFCFDESFAANEMIVGCPECRRVETIRVACDEPSCWEPVSCGTPTQDGYRHTCSKHCPSPTEKK